MNDFRRIMKHHSNSLPALGYGIPTLTQEILKLIESLRSSLAKNAMMTLTEMCQELKKQLDPELETILSKLIKKGADTNTFISEEVKKALIAICQNCSEGRIISVLLNLSGLKAVASKANVCLCMETVIEAQEVRFAQVRDYDKAIVCLGNYLLDGALEVRNAAKKAFSVLVANAMNRADIEKILQRGMSELNYSKAVAVIEKMVSEQGGTNTAYMNQTQPLMRTTMKKPTLLKKTTTIRESESKKANEELQEETKQQAPLGQTQVMAAGEKSKGKTATKLAFFKEGAEFDLLPNYFTQAENNGNALIFNE